MGRKLSFIKKDEYFASNQKESTGDSDLRTYKFGNTVFSEYSTRKRNDNIIRI